MTPLYPHFSYNFSTKESPIKNLYFLNSGRSALELIVKDLKNKYKELVFLIPAFTCTSVIFALNSQEVEFDFLDLDESLNFDKRDLEEFLKLYSKKKIVLIATALFGCQLREYKDLLVIEDRAQGELDFSRECAYQFTSFGKGKQISGWNGGAVFTKSETFQALVSQEKRVHGFVVSYLLSTVQKFITKYFYFFIEKSFLNPEKESEIVFKENYIARLSPTKITWILKSLKTFNNEKRTQNSKEYSQLIADKYLFKIKGDALLRYPIKKAIFYSGVTYMYDYRYTYEVAKRKRGKDLKISRILAYESSFLPTHDLVNTSYIEKVVKLTNEQD
ncbi:MAG: hypothetical protein OIF32_07205 [Campylobacterales bacterium]|nr:hypothetical protein [Campylobacterales bacterium]